MGLGERIKSLRGETSVTEFSRRFGIHRNTLPRYESGIRIPDADFIVNVCTTFQVHTDWLLTGNGPKKIGEELSAKINQSILSDAITALEFALTTKNRVMTPDEKAEIISEIYLHISEDEQGNAKEKITRLLHLVA